MLVFSSSDNFSYLIFTHPDMIKQRPSGWTCILTRTAFHTIHDVFGFGFLPDLIFCQFSQQEWFEPHGTNCYTTSTTNAVQYRDTFAFLFSHDKDSRSSFGYWGIGIG